MSSSFDLAYVDSFAAGTVGPPGQRTFFLQAAANGRVVSLKAEKQQVGVMAQRLGEIAEGLPEGDEVAIMPDLVEPVLPEWTVGQIMVAVQEDTSRIVLLFEEFVEEEDEDGGHPAGTSLDPEDPSDQSSGPARARFVLTVAQARAFAEGAIRLVTSGRPTCPLCLRPMDPDGHPCPRLN